METVKQHGAEDDERGVEEEEEEEEEEDSEEDDEEEEAKAKAGTPGVTPPSETNNVTTQSIITEEKVPASLSRTPSPSPSLTEMTTTLHLSDIKGIVSSDLTKERARQQRKYHSKRGVRHAGRPHGSKAKLDTRVKLDRGGMWD